MLPSAELGQPEVSASLKAFSKVFFKSARIWLKLLGKKRVHSTAVVEERSKRGRRKQK
jgi:hypothetical protein